MAWLEVIRRTMAYRDFVVPEIRDLRERLVCMPQNFNGLNSTSDKRKSTI